MAGLIRQKAVVFGLLGALGCLAGWGIGEVFLAVALPLAQGSGEAASLVQKPAPPSLPTSSAPPPPPEFKERLDQWGAQTGDIQISLIWNNINDLDLYCIDPTGEEIYFGHKESRSGGNLDVDKNISDPIRDPVENIFWPTGRALDGEYKVLVKNYNERESRSGTPFKVTVLAGEERKEFSGTVTKADGAKLIHSFSLQPSLLVAVPTEFDLVAGSQNPFTVKIARRRFHGPVTLQAVDIGDGLSLAEMVLPDGQTEGELTLLAERTAKRGPRNIRIQATAGDLRTEAPLLIKVLEPPRPIMSWAMIPVIGCWTGLLAMGLTVALSCGQKWYLSRTWPAVRQWVPLAMGGLLAGTVAGAIGQTLFGLLTIANLLPMLGFLVGWILLGGLVGWGVGFFIPNLDRGKAVLAGGLGGFLGALALLGGSATTPALGRCIGAGLLGFCLGLLVAVVEGVRVAWLELVQGRERRTVNLGPEPISIGGDSARCTIWTRMDQPVAVKFWIDRGEIKRRDVATDATTTVAAGHQETVGSLDVIVCGGAVSPGINRPAPPPPPPPPSARPPVSTIASPASSQTATAQAASTTPSATATSGDGPTRQAPPPPPPRRPPMPGNVASGQGSSPSNGPVATTPPRVPLPPPPTSPQSAPPRKPPPPPPPRPGAPKPN